MYDNYTGDPIPGAHVFVGENVTTALVGQADATGVAVFSDPSLAAARTVTVAGKCHSPITFVDVPVDTVTVYLDPVLSPACAADGDPPPVGGKPGLGGGVQRRARLAGHRRVQESALDHRARARTGRTSAGRVPVPRRLRRDRDVPAPLVARAPFFRTHPVSSAIRSTSQRARATARSTRSRGSRIRRRSRPGSPRTRWAWSRACPSCPAGLRRKTCTSRWIARSIRRSRCRSRRPRPGRRGRIASGDGRGRCSATTATRSCPRARSRRSCRSQGPLEFVGVPRARRRALRLDLPLDRARRHGDARLGALSVVGRRLDEQHRAARRRRRVRRHSDARHARAERRLGWASPRHRRSPPGGSPIDLVRVRHRQRATGSMHWTVAVPRARHAIEVPDLSGVPRRRAPAGPAHDRRLRRRASNGFDYGSLRYRDIRPSRDERVLARLLRRSHL